jgi:hypothetical protein
MFMFCYGKISMRQSVTAISAAIIILFTVTSESARADFSCRDEKSLTICQPEDLPTNGPKDRIKQSRIIELKNIILRRVSIFEFSHSQDVGRNRGDASDPAVVHSTGTQRPDRLWRHRDLGRTVHVLARPLRSVQAQAPPPADKL